MSSTSSPDTSASAASDRHETTLFLVDPSDERVVQQHPDVVPWLEQGWEVRRSEPRLVESDGTTQFLVVLERGNGEPSSASSGTNTRD